MLGVTHQMVALVSALWLVTHYSVSVGLLPGFMSVIAVMVGALTPDLDQPTANIWRRVLGGRAIGNIFQWFSGGHRHMTHSLIGILFIGWATHWIATRLIHPDFVNDALIVWRAFMVGYISHPIADTLTDMGVPWLWPLHVNMKFPPGPEEVRVTTGSFVEMFIVRGGLIVAGLLLLSSHWSTVINFFR